MRSTHKATHLADKEYNRIVKKYRERGFSKYFSHAVARVSKLPRANLQQNTGKD